MSPLKLPHESADAVKRVGFILAVISFVVTLGMAIGVLFWWNDGTREPTEPVRQKRFSQQVAEGVRYRDTQNFGVDLLAFKSCHVEKRRKGAITFGAFNVLVVDELILNIPVGASSSGKAEAAGGTSLDLLKGDGLAGALLRSQGAGVGRVSGLRVNGLTVNRCATNGVSFVFSAAQAESGMRSSGLRLRDCVVRSADGSAARVKEARLVLKPEPALVYTKNGAEQRVGL